MSRKKQVTVILLVLCLLGCCYGWINQATGLLQFQCRSGQSFYKVSSYYDSYFKDRRWNIECDNMISVKECSWHSSVNQARGEMFFRCPNMGAIAGIRGTYNKHLGDRVFDIKCCAVAKGARKCRWSVRVNSVRQMFEHKISPNNYLTGIYSSYNANSKDRTFEFIECEKSLY